MMNSCRNILFVLFVGMLIVFVSCSTSGLSDDPDDGGIGINIGNPSKPVPTSYFASQFDLIKFDITDFIQRFSDWFDDHIGEMDDIEEAKVSRFLENLKQFNDHLYLKATIERLQKFDSRLRDLIEQEGIAEVTDEPTYVEVDGEYFVDGLPKQVELVTDKNDLDYSRFIVRDLGTQELRGTFVNRVNINLDVDKAIFVAFDPKTFAKSSLDADTQRLFTVSWDVSDAAQTLFVFRVDAYFKGLGKFVVSQIHYHCNFEDETKPSCQVENYGITDDEPARTLLSYGQLYITSDINNKTVSICQKKSELDSFNEFEALCYEDGIGVYEPDNTDFAKTIWPAYTSENLILRWFDNMENPGGTVSLYYGDGNDDESLYDYANEKKIDNQVLGKNFD